MCDDDGTPQCAGEVVPRPEDCATVEDESCDGKGACDGATLWAKAFGEAANVDICGLGVDASDNLVLAGNFKGTISLGGSSFESLNGKSVFIARLDPGGGHIWSRAVGGAKEQLCLGMAVASSGDVILGGHYAEGSPDFGGGPLPVANAYNGFFAKLGAAAGEHVFSGATQGWGANSVRGAGMDNQGSTLIAGRFQGQITIGSLTLQAQEPNETFVARLDAAGQPALAKRFWASSALNVAKIAVDPASGGAVIAGQISGFGLFGQTQLSGSTNDYDSFVIALDAAGEVVWATSLKGLNRQQVNSLAFDGAGGVLVAGEFEGVLQHPDITLGGNNQDGFVMRLDVASGQVIWAIPLGGANNQSVHAVAVDGAGNLLAAGAFAVEIQLPPTQAVAAGSNDAFIAKLHLGTGAPFWLRTFGSLNSENALAAAGDSLGNAVVLGKYSIDLDVGIEGAPLLAGDGDAYLVKLVP